MKFREHRGHLADSLETLVELPATRDALIEHLRKVFEPWPMAPMPMTWNTKVLEYWPRLDERTQWPNTWLVVLDGYGVVGYTDEEPT